MLRKYGQSGRNAGDCVGKVLSSSPQSRLLRCEPLEDRRLLSLPAVSAFLPVANSHNTPVTANMSVTFDQDIAASSVSDATFSVQAMQTGKLLVPPNSLTTDGDTATLTSASPFHAGELVQVSVTTGIQNPGGESLASPLVWQFRTAVSGGGGEFSDTGQTLGASETRDVALGDLDGDHDLDAFVVNSGQPDKVWLNDGQGGFVDSGQSLGNSYSYEVALGDVDGDGDLDAVVGNHSGGQTNRVWMNNGNGVFTDSGRSLGQYTTFGVALGDVDGDGDLDVYIANGVSQADRLWLNNGSGVFSDSGQAIGSQSAEKAVLVDLDGDGDLDAFVGNYGQPNRVWMNNGAGVFSDSGQALGNSNTISVQLGDLNGDGTTDAFVANDDDQPDTIWWNNGAGRFFDSGQRLGNSDSRDVALADVDADGDLDAFVYGSGSRVWLNNGTGTYFDSGQDVSNSLGKSVVLGDLDGDGDLDAFLGNSSGAANVVWRNKVGGEVFGVAWNDVNRDGRRDADETLLPGRTIYIDANDNAQFDVGEVSARTYENGLYSLSDLVPGTYRLRQVPELGWGASAPIGGFHQVTITGNDKCAGLDFGSYDLSLLVIVNFSPAANSNDGSVEADIEVTFSHDLEPFTVSSNSLPIHTLQRGRLVTPPNTYSVNQSVITVSTDRPFFPGEQVECTATTVIQQSGGGELAFPYVWRFRSGATGGTGSFRDSGQQLGNKPSFDVALGDVDGDGDLDALVANKSSNHDLWINDGDGSFTHSGQAFGGAAGERAYLVDVDRDGDMDAIVAAWTNAFAVHLNDGTGVFTLSGSYIYGARHRFGDFDGDGDLDALDIGGDLYLNNGSGVFLDFGNVFSVYSASGIDVGDLDGDGDLDAYVGAYQGGRDQDTVWLNQGDGHFIDSGQRIGPALTKDVQLGDLDGDHDLDAFVASVNGPKEVWLNDGTGTFFDSGQRLDTPYTLYVNLGDIDGDGDLDALVNLDDSGVRGSVVWANDGNGGFSQTGEVILLPLTNAAAIGDLDGDGDLDLFATGYNVPSSVWLNRNADAIEGVKWHDLNNDGLLNDGEPTLPDWTIYLDDNDNGQLDAGEVFTTTAADGRYTLSGLAPGTYTVRELLPPGWLQTAPASGSYSGSLDVLSVTDLNFGNGRLASVSGRVYDDLNENGTYDTGEPGLTGWTVYLDGNDNGHLDAGEISDVTDASGDYTIPNIVPGSHLVRIELDSGWLQTGPDSGTHEVIVSFDEDLVDFQFGALQLPADSISGRLFHDLDGQTDNDGSEPGLGGWTVYVDANRNANLDAGEQSVVSFPAGYYLLEGVSAASQLVRVELPGGWIPTAPITANQEVLLSSGQTLSAVDFGSFDQGREFLVREEITYPYPDQHQMAMNADGFSVVVWTTPKPGDLLGVYARQYDESGKPNGDIFEVTEPDGHGFAPSVGIAADGSFVVAWEAASSVSGAASDIFARRFDITGAPVSNVFRANTYTVDFQQTPSVGVGPNGQFVVAWHSPTPGGSIDIYAQRYDASGNAEGGEFKVNTDSYNARIDRRCVDVDSSGRFIILWYAEGPNGVDYDVYGRLWDASGNAEGPEFIVNTTKSGDQNYQTVAMNSDGAFVAAWRSGSQVRARRFDQNGNPQGNDFRTVASATSWPSVGIDASGDFVVAGSSNNEVYGQAYDATGVALDAQFQVNRTTDGKQEIPQVGMNAEGDWMVVWLGAGPDSVQGLYGQRFLAAVPGSIEGMLFRDVNGNSSYDAMAFVASEFRINTFTNDAQYTGPLTSGRALTADGSEGFLAVWQSNWQDGSELGIYGQRFGADGTLLGPEFRVNSTTTSFQADAAVAAWPNGDFLVAWASYAQDGDGSGIFAQRFLANGTPSGAEFLVNTTIAGEQVFPAVAVMENGEAVIVWHGNGSGDSVGVFGQRYDQTGSPVGGEFRINTYTANNQVLPSIASDGNSQYVVTWESKDGQDGSGSGIYGRRLDAAGSPVGSEFRINSTTSGHQFQPDVAASPAGDFVVTWTGPDVNSWGVFAQRYDSVGNKVGGEFSVNTNTYNAQRDSAVGFDSAGRFVITWMDLGLDGDNYGVFAQRYDSGGAKIGGETRINTTTTGEQSKPTIAVEPDGDFLVVWSGNGIGDNYGVFGRYVELEGPLESWIVYLDADNDSQLDAGEEWIRSDADGRYQFPFLPAGSHRVREVISGQWEQTLPGAPGYGYAVVLAPGGSATNLDFGNHPPLPVEISIADVSRHEGDSGQTAFEFLVTLAEQRSDTVTVNYSTSDGSATVADNDYTATSGTLTFVAGDTEEMIVVYVNGDTVIEQEETFFVQLSGAVNGTLVDPEGIGTILKDDWVIDVVLIPVRTPSPTSLPGTSLPSPIDTVALGATYYVEIWVRDSETPGVGVSGGSVDLHYSTDRANATLVINEDFSVLPSGTVDDYSGLVDDLGGADFSGGNGVAPDWVRLAYVRMNAAVQGDVDFHLTSGASSFSRFGSGNVSWDQVDLSHAVTVSQVNAASRVDLRLVRQPTAFDNPDTGEVSQLPASDAWIQEWEPFWVELWCSTPAGTGTGIRGGSVDLEYNSSVTTALQIEYGPAFDTNRSGTIVDASGAVDEVGGVTVRTDVGDDAYALLARIRFEPTSADQAAVDEVARMIGPYDLALQLTEDQLELVSVGAISSELGPAPSTELFAVPYDIDDTDGVGFGDFSYFGPAFGRSVGSAEPPFTWWADFDGSGVVDFGDFSYFAFNFGRVKPDAEIGLPGNYPGSLAEVTEGMSVAPNAAIHMENDDESTQVRVELVAASSPAGSDAMPALPGSLSTISDGATYYVEVWVQDTGDPGVGIAGGYVDIAFSATGTDAVSLNHGSTFNTLVSGSVNNLTGLVDDFGGGTFAASAGVAPSWVRLGWVELIATGTGQIDFFVEPGAQAFGRWGAGEVAWADVSLGRLSLNEVWPGVTVTPTGGLTTTEGGGTATFTVRLDSEPAANVTIALTSGNTDEGTVFPASLTFTAGNWNTPQTVTITGVDDFVDDGDTGYTIVTANATSNDPSYDNLAVPDVSVTNVDDDIAGITVTPTSGLETTEAGGIARFTITLSSQPIAPVTIPLSSSDTSEGTVPTSVELTAANWNTGVEVTVTGQDDTVDDGDISYIIVTGAAVSADSKYSGLNAADVDLVNLDNDGGVLNLVGTTAGDTITVQPGIAGTSLHRVTINGTLTTYDPAVYTAFNIDGLGGNDTITIVGTSSAETAALNASSVNMLGPAYEVNATSVETIYVYGSAGDTASLTGNAAGSNTFKGRPTYSELQGPTSYHYISGFDTVTATPGGGVNNRALLYGSAGVDVLTASASSATIDWDGIPIATATGFNEVLAFGGAGDTASLTGNGAGGNTLYGRPAYSELKSPAFYLYAGGFDTVTATPGGGINNRALLYGGTGADIFTATPTSAIMDLAGAPSITALGFNMALGIGSTGDTANLTGDSAGDNFLQSRLAYTNMSGVSYYYFASGFQTVTAASGGGTNNRAFFYNDAAASSLTANPTSANMDWNGTSSATVSNFDRVFGFGSTGDTATFTGNSGGSNTFEGRRDYNALTGAGYYHYANGFDSVNATAGGGTNNRAFLYGGSGADTLAAAPTTGTMTWNSGRVAQMSGFDKVFGYGSTDDTANLTGDATATNTFDGYSSYSTLYSAAFYHYVSGFDLVTATAGSATNDRANLYDSVLDDLFTSAPGSGQMDYGDDGSTDISVLAFERIHARFLNGGNDDANLTDSAAVDQFTGTGANGQLTDAAAYWLYLYFDSLGTDRVTLNSSDTGNTVDATSLDYVLDYDPACWDEI